MTTRPSQFTPIHDTKDAKDRRVWLRAAKRADVVAELNQPEQLEALYQRMEQARKWKSDDPGCGPWEGGG